MMRPSQWLPRAKPRFQKLVRLILRGKMLKRFIALAIAACTHCFKGEGAFAGGTGPNGEASTATNRYVNVGYVGGTGRLMVR